VCLYGAGQFAVALASVRDLRRLGALAVADKDASKWGTRLAGIPVIDPNGLAALRPDVLVLSVLPNESVSHSIKELVRSLSLSCEVIEDAWL
jgi:hypothetical protein